MTISHRAEINPELLVWARESIRMDVAYAAKKLRITEEKLKNWEAGVERPTVRQLRGVAKSYKINFGAFFLPEPPELFKSPVKDFRRHHGSTALDINPEIYIDLRSNLNSREIAVELESELGENQESFQLFCSLEESPSEVAKRIRKSIGMSFSKQKTARTSRQAFNMWRELIAELGCLVLQSTKIDLNEMRGYSVFFDYKPLLVVNRKDAYSARTFTLLHELTHILLRSSGLCDLSSNTSMPPHEQKLEVFCNKVASQALVPDEYLLSYPAIRNTEPEGWNDQILSPISRDFGVSREVILRKLLDHNLTTQSFYEENRERYRQDAEIAKKKSKGGFVTPSVDTVSSKGKQFVSLVFDAMNSSLITSSDASDYLGVKAKHFPKIELSVES
ncbi:ImmA/IrrE family metallo-endopeptidase [Halomonas saccharevitans]|uniref:ImmA/IrrE family metallo-endopeptidase n=1 Tax=Halomonas saccharevitans TaxID=416872 RepID=A0ABU3NC27_9GAMM|nr:ImmA/IrrE family metallo-endopeptidase [Halomonas saccharevitans]MDT8878750.1 ImmA/IrrE family metallo-endopeptidase [Halomonas saccharevitans]